MTKKLKMILASSVLCVAAAGGLALAKGGHHGKKAELMQKFDANGDGALDDAERAKLKEAFSAKRAERKAQALARFDADRDGELSAGERAAMKEQRAADHFAKLDANGDGKLSLEEFKAGRMFGRGGHGHGKR